MPLILLATTDSICAMPGSISGLDLDAVQGALRENTKAILLETPSNPMMCITDISGVAEIARDRNIIVIVDNTFMSPWLQRPLEQGADIVVHSAT